MYGQWEGVLITSEETYSLDDISDDISDDVSISVGIDCDFIGPYGLGILLGIKVFCELILE